MDTNTAYVEVKQAIIDLKCFKGEENEDDVFYAANKLNSVLRIIYDNYQNWSRDSLRHFVLRQHDPLKNIKVKSELFSYLVRSIQFAMILKFS